VGLQRPRVFSFFRFFFLFLIFLFYFSLFCFSEFYAFPYFYFLFLSFLYFFYLMFGYFYHFWLREITIIPPPIRFNKNILTKQDIAITVIKGEIVNCNIPKYHTFY
jgi:hypothetical protein